MDPAAAPAAREAEASASPEPRAEGPDAAAPRARKRDAGFDVEVGAAPKRSHKRRPEAHAARTCRDPDCPKHGLAPRPSAARSCVEDPAVKIYPRMSEDAAARLVGGALTLLSGGISMASGREIAGPTEAEQRAFAKPTAALIQRYLGSLGEHSDLIVLAALLIAYFRVRLEQAMRPLPHVTHSRPAGQEAAE